jgi:hypothetical protein
MTRMCDLAQSLWVICCLCSVWSCLGPMLLRGQILWKMLHFNHGYITCLYIPFYLVRDASAQIVAVLLVYVSILACCSAHCIFEKPILAFVDLIHALPTKERKVPNSCFQGSFASREENVGEMHLFRRSLHHASPCWRSILVHLACSLHFGLDLIMELTRH